MARHIQLVWQKIRDPPVQAIIPVSDGQTLFSVGREGEQLQVYLEALLTCRLLSPIGMANGTSKLLELPILDYSDAKIGTHNFRAL